MTRHDEWLDFYKIMLEKANIDYSDELQKSIIFIKHAALLADTAMSELDTRVIGGDDDISSSV